LKHDVYDGMCEDCEQDFEYCTICHEWQHYTDQCRHIYLLVDGRYSFIHTRFAGKGGNAANRSAERHEREIAYLKRKWGPYLDEVKAKGTTRLVVRVKR